MFFFECVYFLEDLGVWGVVFWEVILFYILVEGILILVCVGIIGFGIFRVFILVLVGNVR